jgi:hypothetical protein
VRSRRAPSIARARVVAPPTDDSGIALSAVAERRGGAFSVDDRRTRVVGWHAGEIGVSP